MSYFIDHGISAETTSKTSINPEISDFMTGSLDTSAMTGALSYFNSLRNHDHQQLVLDQLISQLLSESQQNYKGKATSKVFIQNLPKIDGNGQTCAICIEEFKAMACKLPCNHVFHSACILPWLEGHNTCPQCRCELPAQDDVLKMDDDEEKWDPFYG